MESDTRIIDLTTGQLMSIIAKAIADGRAQIMQELDSRLNHGGDRREVSAPRYGIEGIAEVLHCSTSKAQRMKNNGMLDGGYKQVGKSIIVTDPDRLMEIASTACSKEQKRRGTRVSYSIMD